MGNLLNGIYYYFFLSMDPSPARPPTLVLDLQSIWSFVDYFVSSFFEVSRVHPVLKVPV
jgi:hypothetical protein